jgi:hypothetical protein
LSEVYSPDAGLVRAGRWFLDSGIQEPSGGVARFHLADSARNKPVSTEITGYSASILAFLHLKTGEEIYLDRAWLAAHFLTDQAWDRELRIFPFELYSNLAYFFDSGIIVRGLLAVWRINKEQKLLDIAVAAAHGMLRDFHTGPDFHPVLELPSKTPLPREDHWSRSTGCYQAKSALALWDVAEITGDDRLRNAYIDFIAVSLDTCRTFLPGTPERLRVMDRLHAANYFLEALSPLLHRADCIEAYRFMLDRISHHLRNIAPDFARSDVYAQLLRARIYASHLIPVDVTLASEEAEALIPFQREDGGFWFGQRGGQIVPHISPVSTAFAIQALEVWRAFEHQEPNPCSFPTI